jgi:hypothetical protein
VAIAVITLTRNAVAGIAVRGSHNFPPSLDLQKLIIRRDDMKLGRCGQSSIGSLD